MLLMKLLKRGFDALASVRLAIPLLVLIAAATIVGTLIPQGENVALASSLPGWVHGLNAYMQLNDIFHVWWYSGLLVLLGISLLAITIKRVPVVWQQRGKGIAIGILLAHVGVLVFLGGAVYTGTSGFRYYTKLIEGDVKVLPALPFVIRLDRFDLEYYPGDDPAKEGDIRVAKRQDSTVSLIRHGKVIQQITTRPGRPVKVRGVTLLPAPQDDGWAFSLVVRNPMDYEWVKPIMPWAPEVVQLGKSKNFIIAHKVFSSEAGQGHSRPDTTEIFLLDQESGEARLLGNASEAVPLTYEGYTISPWNIRPYTGMHLYQRQGMPYLLAGLVCLMAGLVITIVLGRRTLASSVSNVDTGSQPSHENRS